MPTQQSMILRAAALLAIASVTACRGLTGDAELPAGSQGPNTYNTEAGALAAYRGVKESAPIPILTVGAFTDELTFAGVGSGSGSIGGTGDPVDERIVPEGENVTSITDDPYSFLQSTRGNAQQAIGMLQRYAPKASPTLRGEMYAIEGYAEILLAELYCSGIPLSTLDFEGDFTYKSGSSTDAVYTHAIALLDTAINISSDSVSVVWLADVLKARALLDLGRSSEAAQVVTAVPDTFQYQIPFEWGSGLDVFSGFTVSNGEGENGLSFGTGGDPRVQVIDVGTNAFGVPWLLPAKYPDQGVTVPVSLASGLEARLIQAEAAINANPNDLEWLSILNALRTTCTSAAACPDPAPAGSGGVEGLPPLEDPGQIGGNDSARVSLLFKERAYWFFLTGHRQGDLRRLVRFYHRSQDAVYPTGAYFGGQGAYGSDVTLPIPQSERPNPLFHGCFNRGA